MTEQQAESELERNPSGSFDYLNGRVMKLTIDGESLWTAGYDRDNGAGAASRVVKALREEQTDA